MTEMSWLLIVFVFGLSGERVAPQQVVHKAYTSEEACNAAGGSFRGIIDVPRGAKSLSVCVPQSWFEASGWQRETIGR
jgi:hypothetical protein